MAHDILIVDDEPSIRELLSTSLRFAGFGVRAVGNGAQTALMSRYGGGALAKRKKRK